MFDFFGGATKTLLIDCLKSEVLKTDLYDPELNPLYRTMAEHYGCIVDPVRPGQARDKGNLAINSIWKILTSVFRQASNQPCFVNWPSAGLLMPFRE